MADDIGGLNARVASLAYLRGDVSDIKQRLQEIAALEERIRELELRIGALLQANGAFESRHSTTVTEVVEEVHRKLSGTPLFGLQEHFECENCGSTHLVAARIMCTECKHEAWFGWSMAKKGKARRGKRKAA